MGRNGNGIRKASETSYEIAFTYQGVRCRERIKLKPSPANDRRVANHLGAILDSIEKGSFNYAVTFPDSKRKFQFVDSPGEATEIQAYLDDWLEAQEKQLKSSTYNDYRKTINHLIIPQFNGKLLSEIKRVDIKNWVKDMGCSNKRISNILSVFRKALQDAVDDELIEINPLYGWTYENKEAPKKESDVQPFSQEEQEAILSVLDGQARNMVQFFFWTGLRTSELVALDWTDIDWQRGSIFVTKALTQAADEAENPKTNAGNREVKLLAPAMEALLDQKQYTYLNNKEIFQNPRTKERWTGDQAIRKNIWVSALKLAKVRYRRPYQTRHTYASMMLTAGESIAWLAQQIGHSDWGMLRKVYAKYINDSIPEAGNKAVEMFSKNAVKKAVIKVVNQP